MKQSTSSRKPSLYGSTPFQLRAHSPAYSLGLALPLCLLTSQAFATDFVVDTAVDEPYNGGTLGAESMDGDGLSLREAVALANQNAGAPDSGEADGDTISFNFGLLSVIDPPVFTLSSELTITDDLAIDGSLALAGGALGQVTLDGGGAVRLIATDTTVSVGTSDLVSLTNLTLQNASTPENGGALLTAEGDELELTNVTLSNNQAANGGALYNQGVATLSEATLTGNIATADSGSGGAIFNAAGAKLTVASSTFDSNIANRAGGAIEDQSGGSAGFDISLDEVVFTNNNAGVAPATAAPGNGGAIHITGTGSIEIIGGSATGNVAAKEGGAYWNGAGLMTVSGSSITANVASGAEANDGGGGIFNNGGDLTLADSTLRGNIADGAAGSGGGVLSLDGALLLTNSTLAANVANRAGGAIETIDGELTLTNVTLGGPEVADGNIAGPDGSAAPGNGGGIHISGSTTTLISGGLVQFNQAAREGGGLWNQVNSTMTLNGGLVITDNIASGDAADDGGGGIFNNSGELIIEDTDGAVDISRNMANGTSGSGGGLQTIGGTVTITGASFSENQANRAGGGIEDASGAGLGLTLTNVTLDGNNAGAAPATGNPGSGGGLHVTGPGDLTITGGSITNNVAAAEGGGLWNGTGLMTLVGPSITSNTASGAGADQGGGGVFNAGGTIDIQTGTLIDANVADGSAGSGGGLLNDVGGKVTITGATITNNVANRAGGGIEDNAGADGELTVTDTILSSNNAGAVPATAAPGNGGGLHITGAGNATFTGGTIADNVAAQEGGGLWNGSGLLTVSGSTLSGNEGQGPELHDGGGAIFNNGGTVEVKDEAMLTANLATGAAGSGGGILNVSGGTVTVRNSTLRGNVANRAGGGIEDQSGLTEGVAILLEGVTLTENNAGVAPATAAPGNGGALHVSGPGNVTVMGGLVDANVAAAEGGGLWINTGLLIVDGVTVSNNIASGNDSDQGGGGLFNEAGSIEVRNSSVLDGNIADGTSGSGGGILNNNGGILTVTNSTLQNNRANRAGGGIEDNARDAVGSVTLTNTTFTANNAGAEPAMAAPGSGGAMHISGPGMATITGGVYSGNLAAAEGGALWNGTGTMTISEVEVTMNIASGAAADQGGGGLFNAGGTLQVSDSEITDNVADGASGSGGGILNDAMGTLTVTGSILSGNISNRAGGALEVTGDTLSTLTNCLVTDNETGPEGMAAPGNGGAIHISGSGSVSTSMSTYSGNMAGNEGGGLWNSGAGTLEVSDSTINGNSAPDGGGLFNQAGSGVTTVTNSTVSGNMASNAGGGAQIEGGAMTFLHVTLANNSAPSASGVNVVTGNLNAANSLFADHDGPDVVGAFAQSTTNLVEDNSATSGLDSASVTGVDPALGALADNGGATATHLPATTSPVVDAGSVAPAMALMNDQRGDGFARLLGNAVDIGAVEVFLLNYESWAADNFTEATPLNQRDPEDDADGDGNSNALEWLTGLDPETAEACPIVFSADGDELTFSYPRQNIVPPGAEGLEVSQNLVTWDDTVMPTREGSEEDAESQLITLTLSTSAFDKLFARLAISAN
ncbi:beta strand repeat-containing protein [Roseibacillus ishigakijimensis]|uniref:Extracellular nuclease n=1 Tax=Roseibacillus ishigakijimensis TaxID=454146 RepID=A0A934RRB7_9BACT|nr:right-handed parallel beta-helix repeat-containing protein [Roseibacillus ishigakijimensis]MBK1833619.1 hypothetical protein [Roseibacillus ishigakijimensis]